MPTPDVTVVVITHRGRDLLPACLDSLTAQSVPHRLLVIDNASTDGTAELLAARLAPGQVVRLDCNTGFAGGAAEALARVRTRFVALLNDDAQAAPEWLESLLQQAVSANPLDRRVAAWTSVMVHSDKPDVVQNAGAGLLDNGYGIDLLAGSPVGAAAVDTEVFGFCGGAALLRTAAVRAVGGFPAEFFLYYEDLDTSWRLRAAGWQIRRVSASRVSHAHSATSDRHSELFHRHNERNRLWCLIRNAPSTAATWGVVRFAVTTASLAARRALRQRVPDQPNLQPGLRLRVLEEVLTALPRLLGERRALTARAAVSRRDIWEEWAGRTD